MNGRGGGGATGNYSGLMGGGSLTARPGLGGFFAEDVGLLEYYQLNSS